MGCLVGTIVFHNLSQTLQVEKNALPHLQDQQSQNFTITNKTSTYLTNNLEAGEHQHQHQIEINPSVPIIIGAGLGGTGTRLMADTTCFLGYPTIHYHVGCVYVDIPHESGKMNTQLENSLIPLEIRGAAEMHLQILKIFEVGTACVKEGCKDDVRAEKFRNHLTSAIHDFVSYIYSHITATEEYEHANGTRAIPIALHDTPWPYLLPTLIQEVEQQYNGLSPVIMLSERDPLQYTHRLLKKNFTGRDIMCRNHLWLSPNGDNSTVSSNDPQSSSIEQHQQPHSAFDIIGCIDAALNRHSGVHASRVKLVDVLTTAQNIWDDQGDDGVQLIAAEVKRYQDFFRTKADFSYDMFIKEGKTKREDLGAEMLSEAKRLKRIDKPCDYWNWDLRPPLRPRTTNDTGAELISIQDGNAKKDEYQNQREIQPFVPVILGVGLGTTGTHLMADTTCFLGYPTIHYFVGCADQKSPEFVKYKKVAQMHLKILFYFQGGTGCVKEGCIKKTWTAMTFRDTLKRSIHDFVSFIRTNVTIVDDGNGTIPIALHDTPWPYLMPSLIQEIEQQYDGLSPVIMLSERDPLQYVLRRVYNNHAGRDIMCKNHTWSSSNYSSVSSIDQSSSLRGAFDIIGCIDAALDGLPYEEASQVQLIDVLTTMKHIWDDRGNEGLKLITEEVKSYQDFFRAKGDFSYDMFVQEDATKREDLAVELLSKAKRLKKIDKPCNYWNWRKDVKITRLFKRGGVTLRNHVPESDSIDY